MYFMRFLSPKYLSIVYMIECGLIKHNDMWYITLSHDVRFDRCVFHYLMPVSMRVSLSASILSSSLGKVLIIDSEKSWRVPIFMVSSNFGRFSWHISLEIWYTWWVNEVQYDLFECNSWLSVKVSFLRIAMESQLFIIYEMNIIL